MDTVGRHAGRADPTDHLVNAGTIYSRHRTPGRGSCGRQLWNPELERGRRGVTDAPRHIGRRDSVTCVAGRRGTGHSPGDLTPPRDYRRVGPAFLHGGDWWLARQYGTPRGQGA